MSAVEEPKLTRAQQEAEDVAPKGTTLSTGTPPPFTMASLWSKPVLNPMNLKCQTLPILTLSQASINFHLAWLGFFVAFLSWFAFPPLGAEIRADLKLDAATVANGNIVGLCATLIVRVIVGPLVDRFGPRLVMCALLVIGAIPSGLAGTISTPSGLYCIRFFVGILGGTFVPCVAWTSCFFDKNVVGSANALVGGWGNAGGGATYAVMTALYHSLLTRTSPHNAWRISFAVVPVPILFFVAIITFIFGTDHPAGKWSQRHNTPATALAIMTGHQVVLDHAEQNVMMHKKEIAPVSEKVHEVSGDEEETAAAKGEAGAKGTTVEGLGDIDVAVNEPLTFRTAMKILSNPLTWLPALAYMTSFGFELCVDSVLGNQFLAAHPSLGAIDAGYLASIFGLLNLFTRPAGGFLADWAYSRYGIKSKKYLVIVFNIAFGLLTIGFGVDYQRSASPSLAGQVLIIVFLAIFNEMSNGLNFSLVPHCNAYSNGSMTGLTGAMGNLGGIIFNIIFRYKTSRGTPWIYSGVLCVIVNAALLFFPTPKA